MTKSGISSSSNLTCRVSLYVIAIAKRSVGERLIHLNLPTSKCRQLHGNITEVFKIIHNIYDAKVTPQLIHNER